MFSCTIAADLVVGAVADDDGALHHLRRAGDAQQHLAGHVGDLQLVRHELVEVADQAEHLLRRALADLIDRRELLAVLVEHAVLVVELDELRLLVDDEDRLVEDAAAALERGLADVRAAVARRRRSAAAGSSPASPSLPTVIAGSRRSSPRGCSGSTRSTPFVLTCSVHCVAVPVAELVAPLRVRDTSWRASCSCPAEYTAPTASAGCGG